MHDRSAAITKALRDLTGKEVLVGFPESGAARTGGGITNAALGYIHEFGAPAANIPPRPFLVPGVRKVANQYTPHLRKAAEAALNGDAQTVQRELVAAGIIAETGAKAEITTGNFVPLKPGTIAARARGRGTLSRRPSEEQYMQLVKSGVAPGVAQAQTGIRPLINTGQLRRAITSVVVRRK